MFKTRTRMVSFRLSEDEYERLKDLSLMECARSVSEFARAALCKLPTGNGTGNGDSSATAAPRMEKLEGAMRQLKLEMRQLRLLVETTVGPATGEKETAALRENNQ